MTIEEAVNLLTVKHLENKAKKWIRGPVAHTLYEVWKIADSKVTYHPSESATSNADRIRAMSDEELAEFVANMVDHDWCCDSGCMIKHAGMCGYAEKGCDESALDWLQSPAGEVGDDAIP